MFYKKGVPKNFEKLTEEDLCGGLFFNKDTCLESVTLLRRDSGKGGFFVNCAPFLKTLVNVSVRLLVKSKIFTSFFFREVLRFYYKDNCFTYISQKSPQIELFLRIPLIECFLKCIYKLNHIQSR